MKRDTAEIMSEQPSIILGIDVGTSLSKIGRFDDSDGEVRSAVLFEFQDDKGLIPSAVLYDEQLRAIAFGKPAIAQYKSERSGHLVREFKTRLGERIQLTDEVYLEGTDVYRDFLRYLNDRIVSFLSIDDSKDEKARGTSTSTICITHPAEAAGDRFKERVSGLAQEVFEIPGAEIVSLDEASAVVQFVDHQRGDLLFMKPRRILVIDSGAGTTDFSLANAEYPWLRAHPPLKILEVDRLDKGGGNIDRAILRLIRGDKQGRIYDTVPDDELLIEIIKKKEGYDWSKNEDMVIALEQEDFGIKKKSLLKCIEPTVDAIVARTRRFVETTEAGNEPIQAVVLAGGNTRIPLLRERLEKELPSPISVVSIGENDLQTSVAKGAALYGGTSKPVCFRLAYDVKLDYSDGKSQTLWKREMETVPKNRVRKVVTRFDGISTVNIVLVDHRGISSTRPLTVDFEPPLRPKTDLLIRFEVDASGYLRYLARPLNDRSREFRNVIRRYLLDKTGPLL